MNENNKIELRKKIDEKKQEYQQILLTFDKNIINEYLNALYENNQKIKKGEKYVKISDQELSDEAKKILELMRQYESDIKQIFIEEGELLTHITDVSPENMIDGRIKRSRSRDNDCQTESGDWTFASSTPIDGKNLYLARKSKDGMCIIFGDIYIFGGDNLHIEKDESGKNIVKLNEPNYVYYINPQKFRPVTTLERDRETGEPTFRFTEEWVSDEDIDISNIDEVLRVDEISDVTKIIENYQIFCDVNKRGIAMKIRSMLPHNGEKATYDIKSRLRKIIGNSYNSGNLRYINGEAEINFNQQLMNFVKDLEVKQGDGNR